MGSRRSRETSGRRRNPTVSTIGARAQAPAAPCFTELADSLPNHRAATRLSFTTFVTEAPANTALALAATTVATTTVATTLAAATHTLTASALALAASPLATATFAVAPAAVAMLP